MRITVWIGIEFNWKPLLSLYFKTNESQDCALTQLFVFKNNLDLNLDCYHIWLSFQYSFPQKEILINGSFVSIQEYKRYNSNIISSCKSPLEERQMFLNLSGLWPGSHWSLTGLSAHHWIKDEDSKPVCCQSQCVWGKVLHNRFLVNKMNASYFLYKCRYILYRPNVWTHLLNHCVSFTVMAVYYQKYEWTHL